MFAARDMFLTPAASAIIAGQAEFITPGTFSWTAPAGVTSVCVVSVGGGGGGMYYNASNSTFTFAMSGGGGGGLAWVNDITVAPGSSYTVVVGSGGSRGAFSAGSTAGGDSYFYSTTFCRGIGGLPGRYSSNISGGGFVATGIYGTSGGGSGGGTIRTSSSGFGPAGGGGAGGYTGTGGFGRDDGASKGDDGSGGGGGGGGASSNFTYVDHLSGGGGGVGIYGEGASGSGGFDGVGGGGSGGGDGTAPDSGINILGGAFGGGGGGSSTIFFGQGGDGGGGAVRIIWGADRAYPSTNTGNV